MKALYGCIKSALLWYKMFVTTLKGMGFKLNPYDPCASDATIDEKQCTIVWYDDKVSCIGPQVVMHIIRQIKERFGK